ncbi:MAG TPA: 1-acyl-sn-glycerol-3-phosphate acyltransferase [Saprospiraceae bacterium]|nr:1-acyl-sn-glycerol-3-phosphate acyltransferase [Saprospiraceae bacterium]
MNGTTRIYRALYPDISDWPVYKLYRRRKEFVQAIDDQTLNALVQKYSPDLTKPMARTMYLELIRLKEDPWKSDPPNEKQFWKRVRRELSENSKHRADEQLVRNKELLRRIIHRYSEEIAGDFHKKTFHFARKFLTVFFKRLLNAAAGRRHRKIWGGGHELYNKIKIYGDVERVRQCFEEGTVVIVPTHFSNLDSILIGYALDTIVGLPSFSYGAGLNLYNNEIISYYMSRLGAYRVDRRKKNPIYLETLKTMSNISLQWGVNSLFFPGGTRSRSGAIEKDLKLGLLNSLVEAQRSIFETGQKRKIIIVPLILSYHFVLEARALIDQHLVHSGEEKFLLVPDEYQSTRKILRFAWRLFSQSSDIVMSFGEPMDVMGNPVLAHGKELQDTLLTEYFSHHAKLGSDTQREGVYTRLLAKKIIENYYKYNVVLSSHLVAFVAFEILKKLHPDSDIFGLIRQPEEDFVFPKDLMIDTTKQILGVLKTMKSNGEIRLSDVFTGDDTESVIKAGMKNLGVYHNTKPLTLNKKGEIESQSFKLLYYYHNRLDNYNLERHIHWKTDLLEEAMSSSVWGAGHL